MSRKRKMGASTSCPIDEKIKTFREMPLVVNNTLNEMLPKMCSDDFDKYMLIKGPQEWKDAIQSVSLEEGKRLLLMVICRPNLLQALSVFCTLWEVEEEPALHLYELGLGNAVTQAKLLQGEDPKLDFLRNMGKPAHPIHMYPLMPYLKQKENYFHLNKHFVIQHDVIDVKPLRLNPDTKTPEELYYKKLSNATICSKLQKWPECFAHSLSALDAYQRDCSYLHDVFCYIAQSGGKMYVPVEWCLNVLGEAKFLSTSFEQTWKRLIVFQGILIDQGLFNLENEMFVKSIPLFVQSSEHGQMLLVQHIQSILAQVENNLAFQYVRQTFHDGCAEFCQKEPLHQYSFEATAKLLKAIDLFSSRLYKKGYKEYFRGLYHLYSTMNRVHRKIGDSKTTFHFNLALNNFALSTELMVVNEPLKTEVKEIHHYLKRFLVVFENVLKRFSKIPLMRHTRELSDFYFRIMLIAMFWGTTFQPFEVLTLAEQAKDEYEKITDGRGYRLPLLKACVKIREPNFCHIEGEEIEDFPLMPVAAKEDELQALGYWKKEKEDSGFAPFANPKKKCRPRKTIVSSEALIKQNITAEQVYAFGFQITNFSTEPL